MEEADHFVVLMILLYSVTCSASLSVPSTRTRGRLRQLLKLSAEAWLPLRLSQSPHCRVPAIF